MGLGPGGQPIDATVLNRGGGGGMGAMGPGGSHCFYFFNVKKKKKTFLLLLNIKTLECSLSLFLRAGADGMGFGNMGGRMGGGKLMSLCALLFFIITFNHLFLCFRNGQLWRNEQHGSFWFLRDGSNEW